MNFLLILIYTYQGAQIILFTQLIPMIMAEKGFTFQQQGYYSFINYPFTFKILFAPIVDLFYFTSLGKRKSYLLPIYLINSLIFFILSQQDIFSNFTQLQILGFICCLLLGIQDVAIDGLAFEYCKGTNESAPLLQNIGFTLGTSVIGNLLFNILNSKKLLELETFLFFYSIIGLIIMIAVHLKIQEKSGDGKKQTFQQLKAVLKKFLKQPYIIKFLIISFFERYALATLDATFRIKLIKLGFDKAIISIIDIILIPVKLGSGIIYQKHFRRFDFSYFQQIQFLRLLPLLCAGYSIYAIEFQLTNEYGNYFLVFISSMIWLILFNLTFIIRGNFIQKITIPGYEATSISMLNSVGNLGFKSASSIALMAAEHMNYYTFLNAGGVIHILFTVLTGGFYSQIAKKHEEIKAKLQ